MNTIFNTIDILEREPIKYNKRFVYKLDANLEKLNITNKIKIRILPF